MTKLTPAKLPVRVFPIVGIGASAGGLEAVSRLLGSLPSDTGMAFVLVQHLDPSRESLLPAILQKATKMPVAQAKNGIVITPNQVYIIPPNTQMIVQNGSLRLLPRPDGVQALSVNCFLNSLAEERGNRAVAVILSGSASDGALGVRAIKAEGGIVFAQDEESAGHYGMPQSAAATGVVDFILPPEKIAAELVDIARHPSLNSDISVLFNDAKSLAKIFALLKRSAGVDYNLYKHSTIQRRMLRRLMLHKFETLARYLALLEKNPGEVQALHEDLLIHVTRFFREPKGMAALRAKALPRILKGLPADAPIRVWIPGCSTGEEAYSIAISLFDYLGERDHMNPVQIFATDISDSALERARAGAYSGDVVNFVSPRILRRFFTKTDRGYEIAKRVRDACVFARQDLTKDPPFANVDLISCCNVLIYLGPQIQRKILQMFHYALRPSGALLLGSSETVGEFGDLFGLADKKCRMYYKKPSGTKNYFPLRVHSGIHTPAEEPPRAQKAAKPAWPDADAQKVAERILLTRFAPAGVIVDSKLTVLHFRGAVSRYLEPNTGRANLNLLKMLPAHAVSGINALVEKARKTNGPVTADGVDLGEVGSGRAEKTEVEVIPFNLPVSGERFYIVLFADKKSRAAALVKSEVQTMRPDSASVKRLKGELAATRGYMQTIIEEHDAVNEELKSANEEIISSNEELQSTNEELEIAKEELQAANEELSTVNEELQTRNVDLGQLNNDLNNLITSVHLPIIMVSVDMRIRRFSPMAEKVMKLIPGDVGRPIGDIKPAIALPNIEEIIHGVIESVSAKELEVRDSEGHSYAVRVMPYLTMEKKIEGVVIVFIDNDPIKRSSYGVKDVSAFEAVMDMSSDPLLILDAQMRVLAGSRSLYQDLGLTEDALGASLFEIEGGRWNVPALRAALELTAVEGAPFTRLSVKIRGRRFEFSARRVDAPVGTAPQLLLSIIVRA